MEINQEKVKRFSKILSRVFIIFYWLGSFLTVLCCAFYAVQFFFPSAWFNITSDNGSSGITIDNAIYFNVEPGNVVNIQSLIRSLTPFAIVIMFQLIVGLRQVMLILKSVGEENPFASENAQRLTVIGFDLLIASLVVSVARTISYSMLLKLFGMNRITSNFSIDPALMFTGILVLILAGVFKYGNYLKKEYDATV